MQSQALSEVTNHESSNVSYYKTQFVLITLIVLLGGALRLFEIGQKTVWLDEAFSIWVANHSLLDIWWWLVRIDQHPPLYYTILSLWQQIFGDLQGTVRTLSALFSTGAIIFLYAGVRRLIGPWEALIAAFILAISPFHVNFAQETRMYALLTLTVAAAFYFLSVILTSEPSEARKGTRERAGTVPRWAWLGYAISQAAVMLTHNTALVYFTIAVNLAIGLAWTTTRGKRGPSTLPALNASNFGRRWVFVQGLAFLFWLPWAYPFVVQAMGVDRQFWLGPPTLETVRHTLKNFNFSFIPGWFPAESVWTVLYPALALLGLVHLRRSPARNVLLLLLLFTPIVVGLLVSLRRPIYYDRTLIWASMFYYVLMAAGIRQVGLTVAYWISGIGLGERLNNAKGLLSVLKPAVFFPLAFLILMAVINYTALNGYYFWYQKEDWKKAADYVAEHVAPGDMLLFNATWVQIPFEYYYRHHDLDTELRGVPADLFERGELEPRMMESDLPYLFNLALDRERIWLVYSHDWYTDPEKIIPEVLSQMMVLGEEQEFVGLKILRFDAK